MIALAACTSPLPQAASTNVEPRQCFLASQVNGFSPVDDRAVNVTVGANDVYRLEVLGSCPDIDWTEALALRTTGGGSWICRGLDAEIIVPSTIGPQRCPVRKLSDDEVKAARSDGKHSGSRP